MVEVSVLLKNGTIFDGVRWNEPADVLVEDGDIITLGNTTIRCVMCPGHTKGVMSHFWTLEEDGKTYNVGIYGGAGFGTVSTGYLQHYDLPMSLQEEFPKSIDKVWDEKVDIMLGDRKSTRLNSSHT